MTFRPAQDGDHEFCFLVTERAMRPYVERTFCQWDEGEQRGRHAHEFASRRPDIVSFNGVDVGIWLVLRESTRLVLSKVFILPEFQLRGIGSALLDHRTRDSEGARLPIHLRPLGMLAPRPLSALKEDMP